MMGDVSEVDTTTLTPTELSTTLSVTLDSSRSRSNNSKQCLDITRDDLEKKQLLHTIQLLNLELSQKRLVIDALRNEQASQVEELREGLANATHEKKLLSLRLASLTHGYEQELKKAREKAGTEETQNTVWSEAKVMVEDAFVSDSLLTAEYQRLKSADLAQLSFVEYVRLRVHELMRPLQRQCDDQQRSISLLTQQAAERQNDLSVAQENLTQAKENIASMERQCVELTQELGLVKTQVLEGNYKVDNFDTVKRERDGLRQEVYDLQGNLEEIKIKDSMTRGKLDRLTKELSSAQQSEALLRHDKEYLSRQVQELTQRLKLAEEKTEMVSEELTVAKQAREDMYHQLIKSKEELRLEYDHRLEVEMEGLRARTALDMEQLRTQTREVHEHEHDMLVEARDSAVAERDRAREAEREASEKYDNATKERHTLQSSLAVLQGELQVVKFEKERNGLVHQETLKDLRQCVLEKEKLQKKVELLTQGLWSAENERVGEVKDLERQLHEAQQRLQTYEKVEREMDDIVMASAQMEDSSDAERVLFSYGFGTTIPAQSRRRLQQSVHLARRVLQLEKINTVLRDQLKRGEDKIEALEQELEASRDLVRGSQQPHGYLLGKVKEQQTQLQSSRERVARLERNLASLATEKAALMETKNQMASDLERLLNHREELHLMKAILLRGSGHPVVSTDSYQQQPPAPSYSSHQHKHHHHQQLQQSSPSHEPHPTIFTKHSK